MGTHLHPIQVGRSIETAACRRPAHLSWPVSFERSSVPIVSSLELCPYAVSQSLVQEQPICWQFGHVCRSTVIWTCHGLNDWTYISTANWPSGVVRVIIVMLRTPISSQLLWDTVSKRLRQERAAILQGRSKVSICRWHTAHGTRHHCRTYFRRKSSGCPSLLILLRCIFNAAFSSGFILA